MTRADELPVVIGGFYRSGSSLLRRLLDSHSRIHCSPEVKFFRDFYGDFLNDELAHLRFFWSARSLDVPEKELLALFGSSFVALHNLACARAMKSRWADKNPENVLYLQDWHALLPAGFLFIHVVRDPLDALASLKEIRFPKTVPADWPGRVELYSRFRSAGDAFCLAHQERSFVLRYEELVTDPERTMRAVLRFIGEAFEPEILSLFANEERGRGLEDPKVSRSGAIHAQSISRWRRDLEEGEIASARELLAQWLR